MSDTRPEGRSNPSGDAPEEAAADADADADAAVIRVVDRIGEIDPADWNACANPPARERNPFVSHAFLKALEDAGTVTERTGWLPQHLGLEAGGQVAGVAPAYLKSHSQGEYVFDYGWADAYERAGGRYYPKLQMSVPFTPVPGPRLLVRPGPDAGTHRTYLARGAAEIARRHGLSSVHVTFLTQAEWEESHVHR